MTDQSQSLLPTLMVRYDGARRAAVQETLRVAMRGRGVAQLIVGVLVAFVIVLLFGFAVIETDESEAVLIVIAIALLFVPIAIAAHGIRQLLRQPQLPEIAVTITPTSVLFPAIERPSGLAPRVRAEE